MIHPTDPHLLNITKTLHDAKRLDWRSNLARKITSVMYHITSADQTIFIFQITPSEVFAMARFNTATFASLRLDKSDERKFQSWVTAENIQPLVMLNEFFSAGFKVSISWVADQTAFCMSIIGTDSTRKHQGMVMTTWSDDLEEVILLSGYKHFVVCEGGEWPTQDNTQRWG